MGQVGFLQPVDHPGHHCRLHSGEAVLREVDFFQAHIFSQNLKGLLSLAGSDPAVDHACRLKVVNGSSHVSAGNAGQRCSPKKKVADRGGGCWVVFNVLYIDVDTLVSIPSIFALSKSGTNL